MRRKGMLVVGIAIACLLVLAVAACGPQMPTSQPMASQPTATQATTQQPTAARATTDTTSTGEGNAVTTASGLKYIEIIKGDGPAPQTGEVVSVHYRGTLEDGTEFDNSYTRGQPIGFALGRGMVIPGWDEGIALMNVGGKAKLIIPPQLAYGDQGAGGVIPPNATLTFEVELLGVQPGSPAAPSQVNESDYTTTASGLKYYDLQVGTGLEAKAGQQVTVTYTGWLTDGTKFDSSIDRGQMFNLTLGQGQVIPGWEEGMVGMQVGGTRQLVIPSNLAYGAQGAGGVIPPNATLIFDVELVDTK